MKSEGVESAGRLLSIHKVWILLFASLVSAFIIGLSAQIKFYLPFTPVPVTLQTFALLTLASFLRRHYAIMMVIWYILLGLVGMPFFAGEGRGVEVLVGASGGYIWGFLLSSAFLGYVDLRGAGFFRIAFYILTAGLILYIPGLIQLKLVTQSNWADTLTMGLYPFIAGDIAKILAAATIVRTSRFFMTA